MLNRTEYRKRYEAVEKSGEAWKKTSGIEKVKELQQAIEELMEYMDQQLGIGALILRLQYISMMMATVIVIMERCTIKSLKSQTD